MRPRKDLTGRTFAALRVLRRASDHHGRTRWLCECRCGRRVVVLTVRLTAGERKSCGCVRAERPHDEDVREHDDIERTALLVAEMEAELTGRPALSRMRILQICDSALRRLWLATLHPEMRSREWRTRNLVRA